MLSQTAPAEPVSTTEVVSVLLYDEGAFPNNAELPALVYHRGFDLARVSDPAAFIEQTFARHGWTSSWRSTVYEYHHYHSTAHEVLGCYSGRAHLQLGGPEGPMFELGPGDVLVIPAGVSHKRVDASDDFRVVGAYANGASYDMNRGREGERPAADQRIAAVPPPSADPVQGSRGPLMHHWYG